MSFNKNRSKFPVNYIEARNVLSQPYNIQLSDRQQQSHIMQYREIGEYGHDSMYGGLEAEDRLRNNEALVDLLNDLKQKNNSKFENHGSYGQISGLGGNKQTVSRKLINFADNIHKISRIRVDQLDTAVERQLLRKNPKTGAINTQTTYEIRESLQSNPFDILIHKYNLALSYYFNNCPNSVIKCLRTTVRKAESFLKKVKIEFDEFMKNQPPEGSHHNVLNGKQLMQESLAVVLTDGNYPIGLWEYQLLLDKAKLLLCEAWMDMDHVDNCIDCLNIKTEKDESNKNDDDDDDENHLSSNRNYAYILKSISEKIVENQDFQKVYLTNLVAGIHNHVGNFLPKNQDNIKSLHKNHIFPNSHKIKNHHDITDFDLDDLWRYETTLEDPQSESYKNMIELISLIQKRCRMLALSVIRVEHAKTAMSIRASLKANDSQISSEKIHVNTLIEKLRELDSLIHELGLSDLLDSSHQSIQKTEISEQSNETGKENSNSKKKENKKKNKKKKNSVTPTITNSQSTSEESRIQILDHSDKLSVPLLSLTTYQFFSAHTDFSYGYRGKSRAMIKRLNLNFSNREIQALKYVNNSKNPENNNNNNSVSLNVDLTSKLSIRARQLNNLAIIDLCEGNIHRSLLGFSKASEHLQTCQNKNSFGESGLVEDNINAREFGFGMKSNKKVALAVAYNFAIASLFDGKFGQAFRILTRKVVLAYPTSPRVWLRIGGVFDNSGFFT